jgi:hypothetical protein
MLMLETSAVEVSILLLMRKNRSYGILADVLEARRKNTFLNIAPLGKIEVLSIGDQPLPRMPAVA